MAASANIYASAEKNAWQGGINLTSDTLKMGLLSSAYTPSLTTDAHWSDVNSHEITGTGYTAGGAALTSVTLTLTAANSWGTTWASATSFAYGAIIRPNPGNGFVYRQVAAAGGTTAGSAPTFPTVTGETVADNAATWACLGDAVLVFSSAMVTWTTATFSASYYVIYDAQSGTPSAEPLIVLGTFASVQSPAAQNFEVIPDPALGWACWSPPS